MRKPYFIDGYIYHVFNRGVEKRDIFLDDQDHFRFIQNLYEFNDKNPATNLGHFFDSRSMNVEFRSTRPLKKKILQRKCIVDILLFSMMPNHFHLLLRQKEKDGIIKFMHKLGTGYTMYFNRRNKRVGGLFQGRFKAVMIDRQEHFHYIPHYIHLNPLEIIDRGSALINARKKMKYLEDYRWSSFPDYIGKKNFPSVSQRGFILNVFGGKEKYKKLTRDFLGEKEKIEPIERVKDIVLE